MVHNNNNDNNNMGSIKNSSKRGGTTVQKRERDEDRYKYNKEQLFWHSRSGDTLLGEREREREATVLSWDVDTKLNIDIFYV